MGKAFLFPGQASQYVGMGKDLYDNYDKAKYYYNRASDILPFDLREISFEGPAEELKQTRVTQPAIFVHSVVVSILLTTQRVQYHAAAGHSLGEYSALVSTGCMSFDDALQIVALRGELMQNAGNKRPGTMAAVVGLDLNAVNEICQQATNDNEVVVAANLNAPGQIVISGDVSAVENAMKLAKDAKAKRVIQLQVSGAFHSPLMAPAAQELSEKLNEISLRPPNIPVYLNVTGKPSINQVEIREKLIEQLTMPVLWETTIKNMQANGIDTFIEIGPGKVLQGLVKRIYKEGTLMGVDKADDVENFQD